MDTHNAKDDRDIPQDNAAQSGADEDRPERGASYERPAIVSMSASSMGSIAGTGCVDAAPGISCPT